MEVIIWHGYLLSETGSNIHVQNISRELCRLGHNVHLFMQQDDISGYDFISKKYIFDDNNKNLILQSEKKTEFEGDCFAYQPSISELLPVFVLDEYRGFKAKLFLDLSVDELENYKQLNISAINLVLDKYEIDAFIADHGAISPYLAKETCIEKGVPYIVIIQGSDLEFTIKKSKRYYDLSLEGLLGASSVIAVTNHIKLELSELYEGAVDDLIEVIPSGVDLLTFVASKDRDQSLRDLISTTKAFQIKKNRGFSDEVQGRALRNLATEDISDDALMEIHKSYDDKAPDKDVLWKLSKFSSGDKYITFVGKLMITKGAHLSIAAIGKILHDDASVKHIIVGFGALREHLEILVHAIATRDVDKLLQVSMMIDNRLETRDYLSEFYEDIQNNDGLDEYFDQAADIRERVIFTGLLQHDQIRHMFALTEIQLTLSIFPEAFGLVVLEGTACGAIPITSNHSGLKDVLMNLEKKGGLDSGLFRLTLSRNAITNLTEMMEAILMIDDEEKEALSRKFSEVTHREYGWQAITLKMVEHINDIKMKAKKL